MTNHTNCLHPATKAGRTACRAAGGPRGYADKVAVRMIASGEALCRDCFWAAAGSALMNLEDHICDEEKITKDELSARLQDRTYDAIFTARAYIWARGYLYDENALASCTAHEALLD